MIGLYDFELDPAVCGATLFRAIRSDWFGLAIAESTDSCAVDGAFREGGAYRVRPGIRKGQITFSATHTVRMPLNDNLDVRIRIQDSRYLVENFK